MSEESYEVSEPTIDSHVVRMQVVRCRMSWSLTSPRRSSAAQAIKKLGEIELEAGAPSSHNVSASTATVMRPAGLENSQGVISAAYAKDASDPQWEGDAGIKAFDALLAKYLPEVNRVDSSAMTGYNMATTMARQVLKRCGDNLTRENVMKQAASLKQFPQLGGLLPGVTLTTGPTDFEPIEQLQLMQFKDGPGSCSATSSAAKSAASSIRKPDRPICRPQRPRGPPRGFSFAAIG